MEINFITPQVYAVENDAHKADAGEEVEQTISAVNRCKTVNARQLCIYNLHMKLKQAGEYDIGGSYSLVGSSEYWFLMKITVTFGNNYLLNLFVIARNAANFSVGISNTNDITHSLTNANEVKLGKSTAYYTFKPSFKNQLMYMKTYSFTSETMEAFENKLVYIPIEINTNVPNTINTDIVSTIKMNHNIGKKLAKLKNKDFKLVSGSGQEYEVHRIILAAHSPILRNIVKDTNVKSKTFDSWTNHHMELLLEFLYNGTIAKLDDVDCTKLIKLSLELEIQSLSLFLQDMVAMQITTQNVIDIALLTDKFNLRKLQREAFKFIKDNPCVLMSEGWRKLDSANIAKKLFEFVHMPS